MNKQSLEKTGSEKTSRARSFFTFLKNWTLPVAMFVGGSSYWVYSRIAWLDGTRPFAHHAVAVVQPVLIFLMLFLTFCKVDIKSLRLCRWHVWLLLFQGLTFVLLSCFLVLFPNLPGLVIVEGAIICLICPTATAAAVVTAKLGGDSSGLTSYTIIVNIMVAILVPIVVPMIHPHSDFSFLSSFLQILGKVFPLLICPLFVAALVGRYFPRLHRRLRETKDVAFYLWAVALAIAIAVTARSIAHTHISIFSQVGIALISCVCCAVQFYVGRRIGKRYECPVEAGQALGQKNTIFAIWMGYTFLTPATSIAGGFYSVWHNVYNSWQLYQKRKAAKQ